VRKRETVIVERSERGKNVAVLPKWRTVQGLEPPREGRLCSNVAYKRGEKKAKDEIADVVKEIKQRARTDAG